MNTQCLVVVLFLSYCYAANIRTPEQKCQDDFWCENGKQISLYPENELRNLEVQNEAEQHWVETPKIVDLDDEIEDHQIVKRQSGLNLMDSETNTAALQAAVVNKHNDLRSSEALQENVALMEKMYGNSDLATFAKNVADTCYFDHSSNVDRSNKFGFSYFGENLAVTTGGSSTPESLIQSWYNEKPDYDFNSNSCNSGKMCGHYTQIVWGTSKYIGCAVTFCPVMSFPEGNTWSNAYFFVCNYGPGGNFIGRTPYIKSTTCVDCGNTCIQGLCVENVVTTPAPTPAPTTTSATTTTPAPSTPTPMPTTTTPAPTTASPATTTTTQAPTTASPAPTTTTQAPTTASPAPTTTTQAPTTTTQAPTTTTQVPTTASPAPTTTPAVASVTTSATATSTRVVTSATGVPLIPGCKPVDRIQYCAFYDKYFSICSGRKRFLYMAVKYCKNTCNFCECRDFVNACSSYVSKYNICSRRTRNYWYGRMYCKKTCGLC